MSVSEMAMSFEAIQSYMRKDVKGVNLTLVIHPDDVPEDLFRQPTGSRYQVAMVLIDDQEKPVMPRIQGEGKKAVAQAGLLCRQKSFQLYLGMFSEQEASAELKERLKIDSRSELANDKDARIKFRELINDFNTST
jgi:hypothetical protein|tara:strand:- start:1360 stop:1767 length:408 start_codon:yes stop_codon:yes gene_type:complete